MAEFMYKVLTADGKKKSGKIEANSLEPRTCE